MVAGPIKRFQGFVPQLRSSLARADDVNSGLVRIVVGLFKKIVIADTVTLWITPLLTDAAVSSSSRLEIAVALLAYSVKIYFDFSGYSDIAIGSAHLFGISVPENFSWPYLRSSIAAFWRNWHMSLTSWLADYVYIPLGGSRHGLGVAVFATMVTFAVSGLWHGAAWHFVAWGLYMGVLVSLYRVWRQVVRDPLKLAMGWKAERAAERTVRVVGAVAGALLTFTLVTIGWGLFVMPVDRFVEAMEKLL
jgi:alginate O-acetyltransferase complex protein AlgI